MNANELRIGNLVYVKYTDSNFIEKQGITRVIGLSEEGNLGDGWKIELEALEEDFENVEAYPIELTEEVLLKCGFLNLPILENHFYIKGMLICECEEMFIHDKTGVQLKHLHQLQNLYWCLCEKELKIEL